MQNHLPRIMAVFLVPCLTGDPLLATPLITTVHPLGLFTQQALADQALQVENPLLTKQPKINVLEKIEKSAIDPVPQQITPLHSGFKRHMIMDAYLMEGIREGRFGAVERVVDFGLGKIVDVNYSGTFMELASQVLTTIGPVGTLSGFDRDAAIVTGNRNFLETLPYINSYVSVYQGGFEAPAEILGVGTQDLLLVRNVMIHYALHERSIARQYLAKALRPKGYYIEGSEALLSIYEKRGAQLIPIELNISLMPGLLAAMPNVWTHIWRSVAPDIPELENIWTIFRTLWPNDEEPAGAEHIHQYAWQLIDALENAGYSVKINPANNNLINVSLQKYLGGSLREDARINPRAFALNQALLREFGFVIDFDLAIQLVGLAKVTKKTVHRILAAIGKEAVAVKVAAIIRAQAPLRSHDKDSAENESRRVLAILATDSKLASLHYKFKPRWKEPRNWTVTFFDPKDQNHVLWFRFERRASGYYVVSGERNLEGSAIPVRISSKNFRSFLNQMKLKSSWFLEQSIPSTPHSDPAVLLKLIATGTPPRLHWSDLIRKAEDTVRESLDKGALMDRLSIFQQLSQGHTDRAVSAARKRPQTNALDRTILALTLHGAGETKEAHDIITAALQKFKSYPLARSVYAWMSTEKFQEDPSARIPVVSRPELIAA